MTVRFVLKPVNSFANVLEILHFVRVKARCGNVLRYVGKCWIVVITHVLRYVIQESVLDVQVQEKDHVHVERQSLICLVLKMHQRVWKHAANYWIANAIIVQRGVTLGPVELVGKWCVKNVVVENEIVKFNVTRTFNVMSNATIYVIVECINANASVVMEIVLLALNCVLRLLVVDNTNVQAFVIGVRAILVLFLSMCSVLVK